MTLKVGERYRGMWCGKPGWLLITAIEVMNNGGTIIKFRATSRVSATPLMRVFGTPAADGGPAFVDRIDNCKQATPIAKRVSELEVRYR